MDASNVCDPVLQDFLTRIGLVRSKVDRLILFGSRARGTARVDSDYDLLLVVPTKDDLLLDCLYEAVMDVLLAHGRLVSLKVLVRAEFQRLKSIGTPFMRHVITEGISVG